MSDRSSRFSSSRISRSASRSPSPNSRSPSPNSRSPSPNSRSPSRTSRSVIRSPARSQNERRVMSPSRGNYPMVQSRTFNNATLNNDIVNIAHIVNKGIFKHAVLGQIVDDNMVFNMPQAFYVFELLDEDDDTIGIAAVPASIIGDNKIVSISGSDHMFKGSIDHRKHGLIYTEKDNMLSNGDRIFKLGHSHIPTSPKTTIIKKEIISDSSRSHSNHSHMGTNPMRSYASSSSGRSSSPPRSYASSSSGRSSSPGRSYASSSSSRPSSPPRLSSPSRSYASSSSGRPSSPPRLSSPSRSYASSSSGRPSSPPRLSSPSRSYGSNDDLYRPSINGRSSMTSPNGRLTTTGRVPNAPMKPPTSSRLLSPRRFPQPTF